MTEFTVNYYLPATVGTLEGIAVGADWVDEDLAGRFPRDVCRVASEGLGPLLRGEDERVEHHISISLRESGSMFFEVTVWSPGGDYTSTSAWRVEAGLVLYGGSKVELSVDYEKPASMRLSHDNNTAPVDDVGDDVDLDEPLTGEVLFVGRCITEAVSRWLTGYYGRTGLRHILDTGEFSGSQLSAPTWGEVLAASAAAAEARRAGQFSRERERIAGNGIALTQAIVRSYLSWGEVIARYGTPPDGLTKETWEELRSEYTREIPEWERELLECM